MQLQPGRALLPSPEPLGVSRCTSSSLSLSVANGTADSLSSSPNISTAASPKLEPPPSPHANRKKHRRKKSTGTTRPDGPSTAAEGRQPLCRGAGTPGHGVLLPNSLVPLQGAVAPEPARGVPPAVQQDCQRAAVCTLVVVVIMGRISRAGSARVVTCCAWPCRRCADTPCHRSSSLRARKSAALAPLEGLLLCLKVGVFGGVHLLQGSAVCRSGQRSAGTAGVCASEAGPGLCGAV